MTIWNWILAFAVGIGVAAVVSSFRSRRRSDARDRKSAGTRRDSANGEIRVPLFAGDRFGDDWGRT